MIVNGCSSNVILKSKLFHWLIVVKVADVVEMVVLVLVEVALVVVEMRT